MCSRDLLDMYALSNRASGFRHTYQANPLRPCYNYYIPAKIGSVDVTENALFVHAFDYMCLS